MAATDRSFTGAPVRARHAVLRRLGHARRKRPASATPATPRATAVQAACLNPGPIMPRLSWLLVLALAAAQPLAAQAPNAAERGAPESPGAVLRPGDVIKLRIWREPDLSGDFPVSEAGIVVFPKIGPQRVVGASSDSLKAMLVSAYQVYLRNPSIDVTLLRRITILGAVRTPGLYPVDPTTTVADALALAGGTTPQGNPDKVDLVRGGTRITARLARQTRLVDSPIQSGDQIFVHERSWVSRNSSVVAAAITASVGLILAITR